MVTKAVSNLNVPKANVPRVSVPKVSVPKGWQVSSELRLVEPERKGLSAPLALKSNAQASRATITISQGPTRFTEASAALSGFLSDLAKHAPGLRRLDKGAVTFADGQPGAFETITFEVAPGAKVAQRHIYRVDAGAATHATISLVAHDLSRLDAWLMDTVLSIQST